jgi:hypothetical protein
VAKIDEQGGGCKYRLFGSDPIEEDNSTGTRTPTISTLMPITPRRKRKKENPLLKMLQAR